MRILLIHHNTNNTGDDAIVESTIDQMREQFPDCEIILESANPETSKKQFANVEIVERLFSLKHIKHSGKTLSFDFAINNIPFLLKTGEALISSWLFLTFNRNKSKYAILEEYKKADLVLSMAGDSISENYAWFFRFYEIWFLYKLKKPLILYAQSIGPFSGLSKKMAKRYLSLVAAILARDEKTVRLMNEYGVKTRIERTADVAIALKQVSNEITKSVINTYGLNDNKIGIVMRTQKYLGVNEEEYATYVDGMNYLVKHIVKRGFPPIFVASIPEDANTAGQFNEKYSLNYEVVKLYKYKASEVKTILKSIKMVISPRMHPIILASTAGTPVIGLGKEFKMFDYLKIMGIEEYFSPMIPFDIPNTIKIFDTVISKNEEIRSLLKRKLKHATEISNKNSSIVREIIDQKK